MRKLMTVWMVLALVASAQAGTTVLSEDFEGAAPGTSINGYNGWTATSNMVISSGVIDSGQSASWSGGGVTWDTGAGQAFSYTPTAEEYYILTATLYSPTTSGTDAELHFRNGSNPETQLQGVTICYGDMQFGLLNTSAVIHVTPQPTIPTDVMMIFEGNTSDYYYRANGTTEWTHAGGFTGLGWSIDAYDEVFFMGHGGYAGGIDTIHLEVAPEPATMSLLAFGGLGVLFRRKR
ncbi:MAG: PEP-CTERM sorting domain-containing protein [Phycisphaerae bacterium]|nr:PEP-CTERM sorting domain-containing protein [Phycisphaerae bacterium]